MRGTIAIDNPKLRTIRSNVSMPRSVFRAGNKEKTRTYPGMNRRTGSPRMRRKVELILRKIDGTRSRLARKQSRISNG